MLDYDLSTRAAVINLASGAATGTSGIVGFESIVGSGLVDTLTGFNVANTWNLTGMQSGELNGAVIFTGIENLTGGTSTDSFVFDPAADGFNAVNGGSGMDTLDDSALVGPITVDLATKTAPKLTSFTAIESLLGTSDTGDVLIGANANTTWTLKDSNAGTAGAVSFSSFENLTGGNLNDSFRLTTETAGISGQITGGDGVDTLTGFNVANTWNLTGMQSGELNGAVIFTGIENLTGGTSTDSFVVDPASDGFNAVNGGSGLDTLDDSALVGPITVDLATKTAPKLTSFTAIESLLGTSDTGDVLIGA